jgi:hypothetical protein
LKFLNVAKTNLHQRDGGFNKRALMFRKTIKTEQKVRFDLFWNTGKKGKEPLP